MKWVVWLAALVHAVTPGAKPASDPLPDVESILAGFKAIPGLEAHFQEEKRLTLLAVPLRSEGQIYFVPPDRLARRVTKPLPSIMVIDGNTLSFEDEHGRETMSIDRFPLARPFVDGFMQILVGNTEVLHRLYEIRAAAAPREGWSLRFKPKAAPMSEVIEAIDLTGRGVVIDTLRVSEVGGDSTLTRFTNVDPARRFTSVELRRIFATNAP